MTADDHHETCLLVSHETNRYGNDKPTLRFTARPVRVTADGAIRNFTDTFAGEPLADLTITAQLDHVAADQRPYGWRTEYRQPYDVDLRRAQTMVTVLRKIDRGLERMRGQLGHPESFTAYLARVARALGATRFCWATERRGWAYDDYEHRFADADEMTYHVNRICRDFAKEHMDAGDALDPVDRCPNNRSRRSAVGQSIPSVPVRSGQLR
jgi:hypothetical protein